MEILTASATPSKSKQLINIYIMRWESRNITTQPGEIDNKKSEDIAFVENAGMNIAVINLCI